MLVRNEWVQEHSLSNIRTYVVVQEAMLQYSLNIVADFAKTWCVITGGLCLRRYSAQGGHEVLVNQQEHALENTSIALQWHGSPSAILASPRLSPASTIQKGWVRKRAILTQTNLDLPTKQQLSDFGSDYRSVVIAIPGTLTEQEHVWPASLRHTAMAMNEREG